MVRIKLEPWKCSETMLNRHEELYVGLEDKMIRSDELPDSKEAVARAFDDATVVLCTLSMLSNPKLYDCGLFEVVPLKSLVIDEASQIDVFQLMVITVNCWHLWAINDIPGPASLLQVRQRTHQSVFLRRS
jgi:hypothetical protein